MVSSNYSILNTLPYRANKLQGLNIVALTHYPILCRPLAFPSAADLFDVQDL